jgi:hypothetical protein
MRRDIDLWRRILLDVEEKESPGQRYGLPDFPDVDSVLLNEHCALLIDAGLVEGQISQPLGHDGRRLVVVTRLTNNGHDFLADIRSNTVWEKTKAKAKSAGVSLSIEALKSLATAVAKAHLGI